MKNYTSLELSKLIQKERKAFGGCTLCYGKGYSTTIQFWRGRGESDMGTGDVVIDKQAPIMKFCGCERGQQLKALLEKERERLRQIVIEDVPHRYQSRLLKELLQ